MVNRSDIQTRTELILVAETEPISRLSLSELLREQGYQVLEAPDSAAAVNQIQRNAHLKVVLSCLEMPTWRTVIAQARHSVPRALILGMVRYGALANALEAQGIGADGYLVKPLSFDEVNQWIQRFISGQSSIKP